MLEVSPVNGSVTDRSGRGRAVTRNLTGRDVAVAGSPKDGREEGGGGEKREAEGDRD